MRLFKRKKEIATEEVANIQEKTNSTQGRIIDVGEGILGLAKEMVAMGEAIKKAVEMYLKATNQSHTKEEVFKIAKEILDLEREKAKNKSNESEEICA